MFLDMNYSEIYQNDYPKMILKTITMKNKVLFQIVIIGVFSFGSFAQDKVSLVDKNYNVSDSTSVNTKNLGPKYIGASSPKFTKPNQFIASRKETITDSLKTNLKPSSLKTTATLEKQNEYASVVMINTYERVAEKGYKSVEIFKKLGNNFYFNDELDKAAKWYGELFEIAPDLEPEYYYRYSHSLKAIGENEKSNEMLEKFNQLSGNNNGK